MVKPIWYQRILSMFQYVCMYILVLRVRVRVLSLKGYSNDLVWHFHKVVGRVKRQTLKKKFKKKRGPNHCNRSQDILTFRPYYGSKNVNSYIPHNATWFSLGHFSCLVNTNGFQTPHLQYVMQAFYYKLSQIAKITRWHHDGVDVVRIDWFCWIEPPRHNCLE